jgi:hypothetical protein
MTLFSPAPRWRAVLLRLTWAATRLMLNVGGPRVYPFGALRKLAFIHFAHWSLVDRIPANGPNSRKLAHPYILFQTNFNRGWKEYVEGFCLTIPFAMNANWRGGYGFPSPRPVSRFIEYVETRFTPEAHFYCAYPDASTRMVMAATHERSQFNRFAGTVAGPPPRFRRKRTSDRVSGPVPLGRYWQRNDTISVLTPIVGGREKPLEDLLTSLPKGLHSPLASVERTHMARWSVVRPLPYKKTGKAIDPTWYLLFASWFRGSTEAYVRALRKGLGDLADEIWGNCSGYRGWRNEDLFFAYLIEYSIKPRLEFAAYPQSVTGVRAALELHAELTKPVEDGAGKSSVALERAWLERHG